MELISPPLRGLIDFLLLRDYGECLVDEVVEVRLGRRVVRRCESLGRQLGLEPVDYRPHVDPDVTPPPSTVAHPCATHAHPDRALRERPLAVLSGGDRIGRSAEGDEERVTLRVHFDAVVRRKDGAKTAAMLAQDVAVAVAELLQQPR